MIYYTSNGVFTHPVDKPAVPASIETGSSQPTGVVHRRL